MDELINAMREMGVVVNDGMSPEQVQKVAKTIGLNPEEFVGRKVEIVPYTNKRGETNMFVSTPPFSSGKGEVRGLFVRVEALDQAIEDLTVARGLLEK